MNAVWFKIVWFEKIDSADGDGRRWTRIIREEFDDEGRILKNGFEIREIDDDEVMFVIFAWLKRVKYDLYGSFWLRLVK